MDDRLRNIVNRIKDKDLRRKVVSILEDLRVRIGEEAYSGLPLEESPAGLSRHHSYPGGFVEHVIATAEVASTMCKVVKEVYGGEVSEDLVIAGVLLHDAFKPLTYYVKGDGTYGVTSLGERIDHLSLIVSEMIHRGFPLDLIHVVCAHHGEAGPIEPRTVEALICHLADIIDSRLNGEVLRAARHLVQSVGEELKQITSKEAFEIVRSKAIEGDEGVRKAVERMKRERLKRDDPCL